MAEKVTSMILKVNDLQCPCCYKKVKKILCKFPQIRDQEYDEKQNLVRITVVCCSPEKIRGKLCCKGGKVIKSIEIVEAKPKQPQKKTKVVTFAPEEPPEKSKPDPPPAQQPAPEGPETAPVIPLLAVPEPQPQPRVPSGSCCGPCSEGHGGGPCHYGDGRPSGFCCGPCSEGYDDGPCHHGHGRPSGFCCGPCSEGYGGGPCHFGYGRPVPPPPCSDRCWCRCRCRYSYGKGCDVSCCDYYSEENTGSCNIM